MRIRHLQYFLVVAEEQSYVRASARVHIEPSPLSRAIRDLEEQLGVELIQRCGGCIRLTWPGEVFREEARRIVACMEGARRHVRAASQGCRGRIRIGLADSLAQSRLTRLLARCREDEPGTEIQILEMTVHEMLRGLAQDQIDVGLTVEHSPVAGLVKQPVWSERLSVAMPTHHPLLARERISMAEAIRYPLVLGHPEKCTGAYNLVQHLITESGLPRPTDTLYASGHETMIMMVAAGYGIGIGLESQIAVLGRPGVIIRATADDVPNAATYAVTTQRPCSPELTRFIQRALVVGTSPTRSPMALGADH